MNKEKQDLNIREALFRKGVELDRKIAPNIYTIKKIYGKKKTGLCCKIFINSFESDVREEYHIGKKLHAAAPDLFIGTYELIRFTIPHPLFTTENCDCYAMTMELGVPLDQVNTSRNTYFFKSLIEDICRCLSVLHSIGYYHFDIKPQNIVIFNGHFSLIDYGISKKLDETVNITARSGTLYYMAPETLKGEYSPQSDIYSVGMIIRYLLKNREYDLGMHDTPKELYLLKKELPPLRSDDKEAQAFLNIVNKATAFDRIDRFLTTDELFKAVKAIRPSSKEINVRTNRPLKNERLEKQHKHLVIFSYFSASKSENNIVSLMQDIISANKSERFGRIVYSAQNTLKEVLDESRALAFRAADCDDFVIIHIIDRNLPKTVMMNDKHIIHIALNHSVCAANALPATNFYEKQIVIGQLSKLLRR